MKKCLKRDDRYQHILTAVRILYILTGIFLGVRACLHHNSLVALNSFGTLILIPGLCLVRRLFHWTGGRQLETYIYIFIYLSWTLGGAGGLYGLIPYYDKAVHFLSGLFVALLGLVLFRMLESRHSRDGENKATGCMFVFFNSVAFSGLFEICEFVLDLITHSELQHVLDTGVTDTMQDIIACTLGALVFLFLMIRSCHGKRDPVTDAAEVFVYQNTVERESSRQHVNVTSQQENMV